MHSLSGLVTGLDVQFSFKPVHRKHSTLSSACLQASYSSSLIQSLSRETCDMSESSCTIPQGACAQVVECFCVLCPLPSPQDVFVAEARCASSEFVFWHEIQSACSGTPSLAIARLCSPHTLPAPSWIIHPFGWSNTHLLFILHPWCQATRAATSLWNLKGALLLGSALRFSWLYSMQHFATVAIVGGFA